MTLIAAQITSGDFTAVNTCGNSLNPHSTCSIGVAFQPKNVGALAGLLSVSDEYRSQTVTLNGTGVAPPGVSLAPFSTVDFANTGVGLTSSPQTVTLTNNGGVPLLVQSVALTGDFSIVPGSNNCGTSLGVNTACTMQVVFNPSVGGPRSGILTITDNAPNSPQTLQLIGSGVDFTLGPDGSSTVTITSGQSAVFPLLLTSAANIPGIVTLFCPPLPPNSTCNMTPASVALGNTTTVSMTILTGVASTSSAAPLLLRRNRALWLATLLPLSLLALRRHRLPRLVAVAFLCVLIGASGCGAGRDIPLVGGPGSGSSAGPPTPAGTYTVVASASSAGLTRTVNFTLIVQ